MLRSALLLAAAGAQYYKLDNMVNSFVDYEYTTSMKRVGDQTCTDQIEVPFHADPAVRGAQCYARCARDRSAPGCAGHAEASGSNVLCLPAAELLALCTNLADCYAVSYDRAGGRGTLLRSGDGCTRCDGCGTETYVKTTATKPECELGVGVMVSGGPHGKVQGLYERNGEDVVDGRDTYGSTSRPWSSGWS